MGAFAASIPRRWPIWLAAAGIAGAAMAAAAIAQPAALAATESRARGAYAALASAAIVAAALVPLTLKRRAGGRTIAASAAAAALGLGLAAFWFAGSIQRQCSTQYAGRAIVIGTDLTPLAAEYVRRNPQLPLGDVLVDSAGDPERVWTRESIARCRVTMAATYFLWVPLLIVSLAGAVLAAPAGQLAVPTAPAAHVAASPPRLRYDAFISYRHGGADADVARQVLDALEAAGYAVAIDERDFAPNASVLQEMERAIRESRYTIAIVSGRYLQSGHCEEEAIVTSVLDMADRKRRLIPLVIQHVEMPAWLFGLVGIDCTRDDALVDPVERLKATLGAPLRANL